MAEKETEQKQNIELRARAAMSLCGIRDVVGFEETIAVFDTVQGRLTIEGEGLHMETLSVERGEAVLVGKINGLYYEDGAVREGGFLRRIFAK